MNTLATIYQAHGQDLGALDPTLEIPVLDSLQCQGDVMIRPVRAGANTGTPVPPEGVPVVRGENGGNTHLLVGEATWAPTATFDERNLTLGTVTVTGPCWLLHPEHGANGLAPGTYEIRRQREQAEVLRVVAD